MTGNIIANTGFIKQYGTVISSAGIVSLAANHIAIWAGEWPQCPEDDRIPIEFRS
jgi:hypothetical protein